MGTFGGPLTDSVNVTDYEYSNNEDGQGSFQQTHDNDLPDPGSSLGRHRYLFPCFIPRSHALYRRSDSPIPSLSNPQNRKNVAANRVMFNAVGNMAPHPVHVFPLIHHHSP